MIFLITYNRDKLDNINIIKAAKSLDNFIVNDLKMFDLDTIYDRIESTGIAGQNMMYERINRTVFILIDTNHKNINSTESMSLFYNKALKYMRNKSLITILE
jgi:hypothetical protein